MVEHHRAVVGPRWPVRSAEEAWKLRRHHYSEWLLEGSGLLLLARAPGAHAPAVGYAVCRIVGSGPTFDLGPLRGEVEDLVVAETLRGTGIGTVLLERCRLELSDRGVSHWSIGVVEGNAGAQKLYERFGFRPWLRSMLAPIDDAPS